MTMIKDVTEKADLRRGGLAWMKNLDEESRAAGHDAVVEAEYMRLLIDRRMSSKVREGTR